MATASTYAKLDKDRKEFIETEFHRPEPSLGDDYLNRLEEAYVQRCAADQSEAEAKRKKAAGDDPFPDEERARALRANEQAILEDAKLFNRSSLS